MLKLGEKNITKLYYADKVFSKAYLGAKLAFQAGKPIFLDYVILDANSWINTGFKPNLYTTRVVLDFMLLDGTTLNQPIFGSRPTNTATIESFNVLYNNGYLAKKLRLDCTGDYTVTSPNMGANDVIKLDCHNNKATVNGTTYTANVDKSSYSYSEFEMYLGNINNAGEPYSTGCNIAVASWQIYDNGTLVQDLRPSKDSNGVVCFYDLVTKKYFYNQGTGELKASDEPTFLDYIVTDGKSYIDTEYIANENSEFEYIYYTTVGNTWFFGSRTTTSGSGVGFGLHGGVFSSFGTTFANKTLPSDTVLLNQKNTIVLNKNSLFINGADKTSLASFGDTYANKTVKLFTMDSTSAIDTRMFNGKCYAFKVRENGVLVRDFKPCKHPISKVYCFYDAVARKYHFNKGTGTLGYS